MMKKWFRYGLAFLGLGLVLSASVGHIIAMSDKAPFQFIEIAPGRSLHVSCAGPKEAPFVLYDAGAFGIYTDGWWVQDALKADFRVCLYDRAGMGWSPAAPKGTALSADWHVEDMRKLKTALGVSDPIYLIGHSMAGLRLHVWANRYPEELAGLIFIDAARPQNFDMAGKPPRWLQLAGPIMGIGSLAARVGLTRAIAPFVSDRLDLPAQQAKDKRRTVAAYSHFKTARKEILAAGDAAAFYKDTKAETRPVSVFAASAGGGGNAQTAAGAREKVGFGRTNALPDESHVSLLAKPTAALIAADLKAMHAFNLARQTQAATQRAKDE